MDEAEVLAALTPLVVEVTRADPAEIRMESCLMTDLGAASLDLLDLSFLIEERFGIRLEADEFTRQVEATVPGGIFEHDGFFTADGLAALRGFLPEVPAQKLAGPLRQTEIPSILTVGVFVHLVQRKIAEKETMNHA
jgi:acyl carrier protein